MARDIDLIAVPRTEEAVEPAVLAEAIRAEASRVQRRRRPTGDRERPVVLCRLPGMKPRGRLRWTFHLGGGPYIDLSVFPPLKDPWPPIDLDSAPKIPPPRYEKREPDLVRNHQ